MQCHGALVIADSRTSAASDVIARELGASADVEDDETDAHAQDAQHEEHDCARVHVLDEGLRQDSVDRDNETSGTWRTKYQLRKAIRC